MRGKHAILILALCAILSGCVQLVYKVDPQKDNKNATEQNDSPKKSENENPSDDEKKSEENKVNSSKEDSKKSEEAAQKKEDKEKSAKQKDDKQKDAKKEQGKNQSKEVYYENKDMNEFLDFQGQEQIKDFLVGNWIFVNPVTKKDAAWLEIDEDMSYELKVQTPNSGYDHTRGKIALKDYQNEENGYGNILSFGIDKTLKGNHKGRTHNGDYALSARSIVDGSIMIELTQTRAEDTVFFEYFYESNVALRKVLLRTIEVDETPDKNVEIYAICWKIDEDKNQVWLDEVNLEQRVVPDGDRIAKPYTLKSKDLLMELRKSQVESLNSEFPSTLLVKVQIDKDSKITDIEKINWRSALIMPHIAISRLQSLREVQEFLNQGEDIHYLEQTVFINGQFCAIYGVGKMLGTPSLHNFEMKKMYAIDPQGNVYVQDLDNPSNWVLID